VAPAEGNSPETTGRPWAWLLAIVVLGAALRLYGLGQWSFWYDEAAQVHLTQYVSDPAKLLDLDYSADPPLFPFLVGLWYGAVRALPGVEAGTRLCDTLLRLMPCAFGVLGIVLTFLFGRVVLKRDAPALIGAFLFAVSPFQIHYAQDLRAYSLHVVLALLATLLAVRALEQNRLWQWAALAIVTILGIYNNTFTVWIVMALSVYFVATFRRHWRLVGQWTAWNLAVIVLCLPTLRHTARVSAVFEQGTLAWYPYPTVRTGLITVKDFFAGYAPNPHIYWLLFVAAGILIVIGLAALRRRPSALLLLFLLAAFPIAVNVAYANMRSFPYYTHRLLIASAVPCYLLAAVGMHRLRPRALTAGALLAVSALTVPCLIDYYAQRMHPSWHHIIGVIPKVDNRGAAAYVAARLEDGDFVGHRTHLTALPFYCYLDAAEQAPVQFRDQDRYEMGLGFPHKPVLDRWRLRAEGIETVAGRAQRMWLVASSWQPYTFDLNSWLLRTWLDAHAVCVERVPFDGLTLHLYRLDPELQLATRTNRVVDRGLTVAEFEEFPDTPAGRTAADASAGLLRQSLSPSAVALPAVSDLRFELAPTVPQTGPSGTGVDWSLLTEGAEARPVQAAAFPQQAAGAFAYRFVLTNTSDVPRAFQGRVFESADVIEAVSFHRADGMSDHWFPSVQQIGAVPGDYYFGTSSMVGVVTAETPSTEAVYRDLLLPDGDYDVFFRFFGEVDPVGKWAADGTVTATGRDGAERPVGIVPGNVPDGEHGWTWRRAGECHSDGGPLRLTVRASKREDIELAHFVFERIVLAPVAWGLDPAAMTRDQFEVSLGPGEARAFAFSSALDGLPSKRIDVRVLDPLSNEFRRLWFYVERASE